MAKLDAMILRIRDSIKNERGDTNFISIMIILGVVVLLAGAFIYYETTIVGQTNEVVNSFDLNKAKIPT